MAATAYASLVSLQNTLDLIHIHPLISTFFDINQNKSLFEKVNFLLDFVEKYSDADSREVEDLVRRIADAAHQAEDMIEVHAADQVRGRGESPSILPDLQKIMEEMESIKEEVINVKVRIGKSCSFLPDMLPSSSTAAPPPAADEATIMVGFDHYKHKLLDDLLGDDADRQIISITGMGGIGKTTLARNLYENSLVVRHFNVRVWVTVSQDSSARRVFLQALSCLKGGSIDRDRADDQQLSVELYETLFNRRYLIILDDVWSVEIWDKIKFFFPQNNNRSRIVVTTRESKLVGCIGSSTVPIGFLDKECSWELFCEKTFPQQGFPPELEAAGKEIVKKCGGLPLAISVIGGLLIKSPRTQQYWEQVAENRSWILNSGENKPLSILYLSYKYLPLCLKPCFLHFGSYPEDFEMGEFKLVRLWIAEGYIKANKSQSLEEIAESYINELVGRNLISLVSSSTRRYYSTHDVVRALCLEIGEKENFYCVRRSIDGSHYFITDQKTTARFYHDEESHSSLTTSIIHPLIVRQESRVLPIKTRLLRVLRLIEGNPYFDALQEFNVRHLQEDYYKVRHPRVPFSLLSQFWSLQTLIVKIRRAVEPIEIWKMPQLRHINIWHLCLTNPPPSDDKVCVLENLHTLKTVENLVFTEEVCKRIPNIKALKIRYDLRPEREECSCYHLENLGSFNKLEFLFYYCKIPKCCAGDSLRSIKFPGSLKELILNGCKLEWSHMAVVASLPHLKVLRIGQDAIAATEWIFFKEKFVSLKFLHISFDNHVKKWIADSSNFPVLEDLSIHFMEKLRKIPSGIGEIPTLRSIDLLGCMESVNMSAVEILYEYERFENLGLRVEIKTYKSEILREKVQHLGFTCQNLVIRCE